MLKNSVLALALVALCSTSFTANAAPQAAQPMPLAKFLKKPKLVVVIVIDQCRSDFLTRFANRFKGALAAERGGLKFLMERGAYFPFAKYDILQSMTCPGHATVLTGAYPYQMGIPMNEWYDVNKRTEVYCAEDEQSPIVGRDGAKPEEGLSPRRLIGSTVGDELKISGATSKVVAVALKDRSAIMMGGHKADIAVWIEEGKWVSSKYYLEDAKLPSWVTDLNKGLGKDQGALAGPYGVKITTDAAIKALESLKLGETKGTDILAVSYSSHDMLGHQKGLHAPEMEEVTLYEDESIGKLITAIAKKVKLEDVVFAFTGDHGVAPAVDHEKPKKLPAGAIESKVILAELNTALEKKWGTSSKGPWLLKVRSLHFYLNPDVIADKKKDRTEVENEVKRLLVGRPGVAHVITRTEVENKKLPSGQWERQILKTYLPGKSGDVYLMPLPFWVEKGGYATHMTGYNYDRSVPLILVGAKFKPGVYSTPVEVVDLAPTLSFILGIVPPSGAEGRVLSEAL